MGIRSVPRVSVRTGPPPNHPRQSGRRGDSRPASPAGIDNDRDRPGGPLLPRLADPELADADGPVELTPATLPPLRDVAPARVPEHLPEPLLAAGIGVGHELDAVGALDLLEAVREELDHPRPRLLGPRNRDLDRDAARGRQRNALFSLSKNPSSARYVSSVDSRSNSSSSRRRS